MDALMKPLFVAVLASEKRESSRIAAQMSWNVDVGGSLWFLNDRQSWERHNLLLPRLAMLGIHSFEAWLKMIRMLLTDLPFGSRFATRDFLTQFLALRQHMLDAHLYTQL